MFSHSSLASPSSLRRSASPSMLSFLFGEAAEPSAAPCWRGVWQARQCSDWARLMSVQAGQGQSAGQRAPGDSGDSSSFRTLRRRQARSSAGLAAAVETASVEGEGLREEGLWLTSGGGTSRRLQGSGTFWAAEFSSDVGDGAPPAGSARRDSVDPAPSAGTSRVSAGIWGSESFRGPPQAEQDMEVGVFCSVQREQSQVGAPSGPPSRRR